jgi:hypothetical protein
MYTLPGILVLLILLLAVSGQSFKKSASANPVDSLRDE